MCKSRPITSQCHKKGTRKTCSCIFKQWHYYALDALEMTRDATGFEQHLLIHHNSESTSIPVNPRTTKPVGYAFVDVSTPDEAQRALSELNGKTILDRKVSVQLARKPDEPASAAAIANGNGESGEGQSRRRSSGRGRGRGRGRGGRGGRGGRTVSLQNFACSSNTNT